MQVSSMDSNHTNEQQFYFQHAPGGALPLSAGANLICQPLVTSPVPQGGPMVAVQSSLVNHTGPANSAAPGNFNQSSATAAALVTHQQLPPPAQPTKKRRPKKSNAAAIGSGGRVVAPVGKNNSSYQLLRDVSKATELTFLVHQAMNPAATDTYTATTPPFHRPNSGGTYSPQSQPPPPPPPPPPTSHTLLPGGPIQPSFSTPTTSAIPQQETTSSLAVSSSASLSSSPSDQIPTTAVSPYLSHHHHQNSVSPNNHSNASSSSSVSHISRPSSSAIDSSTSPSAAKLVVTTASTVVSSTSVLPVLGSVAIASGLDTSSSSSASVLSSGTISATKCEDIKAPLPPSVPSFTADMDITNDSDLTPLASVVVGGDTLDDESSKDFPDRTPSSTPTVPNSPAPETAPVYKMDMIKLCATVDYVLTLARSDSPVEGIFVLPSRIREVQPPPRSPSPLVEMGPPATPVPATLVPGTSPGFSPRSAAAHLSPRQQQQQQQFSNSPTVTNTSSNAAASQTFAQPTVPGAMYSGQPQQRATQAQQPTQQQRVIYTAPNYYAPTAADPATPGLVPTGASASQQARPLVVNTTTSQRPSAAHPPPPPGLMYVSHQQADFQQSQQQSEQSTYAHQPPQQHMYIHQSQAKNVPAQRQVFAMPLQQPQTVGAFGPNTTVITQQQQQQQSQQPQLLQHTQFPPSQQIQILSSNNKSELFSVQQSQQSQQSAVQIQQVQTTNNSRGAATFNIPKGSPANNAQTVRNYVAQQHQAAGQQQASQVVNQPGFVQNQHFVDGASPAQGMATSPSVVTKFVSPHAASPQSAKRGSMAVATPPLPSTAATPSPALPPTATQVSKKRPGVTTKNANTKRRKTTPAAPSQSEQKQMGAAQKVYEKLVEKLKVPSLISLIHQPIIPPYTVVLPPPEYFSEAKQLWPSADEEAKWLREKAMKYNRSPLTVKFPKPELAGGGETAMGAECDPKEALSSNRFIFQNLSASIPDGPLLRCSSAVKPDSPVCPSPEPQTVESSIVLLSNKTTAEPQQPVCGGENRKNLLNMLTPNSPSDKCWSDRSSPPLTLYHLPNPQLIQHHLHQANSTTTAAVSTATNASKPAEIKSEPSVEPKADDGFAAAASTDLSISADFSTVQLTIDGEELGSGGGGGPSSSPVVDSETGEVLSVRSLQPPPDTGGRPPVDSVGNNVDTTSSKKLHVTFTLSPSMADDVQKIVHNITDRLGINYDSVSYEVTRSGNNTELRLDQKYPSSAPSSRFQELEQQLRNRIAPLTLRVQNQKEESPSLAAASGPLTPNSSSAAVTPTLSSGGLTPSTASGKAGQLLASPATLAPTATTALKHEEMPVTIASLRAQRRETNFCKQCELSVSPQCGIRKKLGELQVSSGYTLKSDSETDEVTFCSTDCLNQFTQCLADTSLIVQRVRKDLPPSATASTAISGAGIGMTASTGTANNGSGVEGPNHVIEYREQFFNVPVVLQGPMPKHQRPGMKRQLSLGGDRGKSRKQGGMGGRDARAPPAKKWKGMRWRSFSSDHVATVRKRPNLSESDIIALIQRDSGALFLEGITDQRMCALCHVKGDAAEDGPGRLLCFDVDKWLHINCALWCFDVYETLGGSLNTVDACYQRAIMTMCSYCGMYGAGLPCYNPKCSVVYHLPCAQAAGCMFFTDRGMYCPIHQPKEHHMQLRTLSVGRRVYISRDENKQIARVIHEEEQKHLVRIGSLILRSIGQLLPHQIERGVFHTRRFIYPIGFKTTRIYWSMRQPKRRAWYVCEIRDREGRPEFVITAIDKGLPNEVLQSASCDGVWKVALQRIEKLRQENGLVKMFPQHIQGEELFGLTEPHIVRAIESLPGVENLKDYAFKFGRMQLIQEMPLAINPTGCARSEPKLRTHIRLTRLQTGPSTGRHFLPITVTGPGGEQTPYSKQYISSRSQQYRKMKAEAKSNVILGRSRIQGLGLFAAKDIEKYTMVIEYIGELIRNEVANRREKEYEAHNRGTYMFRLDDNQIVDATMSGGLARYINHSCQPNCVAEVVTFERECHIIIVANKKLEQGEELTYDYKFDFEDNSNKIPCLCGAPTCKKWMN